MSDTRFRLAEIGPAFDVDPGRPTIGLLNANPFPQGIANLGFQVIAKSVLSCGCNVEIGFADTMRLARPFLHNHAAPKSCLLIAVSVPFEDTYHHVPRMLEACGLDPWASRRAESDPIVIGGGMAMINPMPLSSFFDAVVIGDGREVIREIVLEVQLGRRRGESRLDLLARLAALDHVYVPSFYRVENDDNNCLANITALRPARPEVHAARPTALLDEPICSLWTSPRSCYEYRDYFSIMMALGCHHKCPFCVVGHTQGDEAGRAVQLPHERVLALAGERRVQYGTRLVKLFFASAYSNNSVSEAEGLKGILLHLVEAEFESRVGSLNIRQVDDDLLRLMAAAGQGRVTLAPETAESLRFSVGKAYSKDERILEIAELAGKRRLGLNLYTMLGLPGERPDHVRALANLIREVRAALNGQVALEVSVNPMFSKAQTVYERQPTLRPEEVRRRFAELRALVGMEPGIEWASAIHDPLCYYQPILARGGAELAAVLYALRQYMRPSEDQWRRAVADVVGDDSRYFNQPPPGRPLPWQHIVFSDRKMLARRYESLLARVLRT